MPIVHVPQRKTPQGWSRLLRFFHREGKVAGVSYRAHLEIVELTAPDDTLRARVEPIGENDPG